MVCGVDNLHTGFNKPGLLLIPNIKNNPLCIILFRNQLE